jgi:hypothetical protein
MTIPLDLPRIIKELNLDVPIYRVRAHGDCVELHLYGGKVVTWKPPKGDQFPVTGDQEPVTQHPPQQNSDERETKKRRQNK